VAVNNLQFGADVSKWVAATEARMLAVFRESTKRTVSIAQRRIPVDTGFARASIRASLSEMPMIDPNFKNEGGGAVSWDQGEINLVIAGAVLGDTIYVGWTANYVGALEAGHSSQAPSGFVRLAALQWRQTVAEVSQEAQSRAAVNRGIG
jgi:hypothetical protein